MTHIGMDSPRRRSAHNVGEVTFPFLSHGPGRTVAFRKTNEKGEPHVYTLNANKCHHHVASDSFCRDCLKESITTQPAWESIDLLKERSRFVREIGFLPAGRIAAHDGTEYSIIGLESGKDKTVKEVHSILKATFGAKEVEREDVMRSAIDGRSPWGTPDIRYRIFVLKDTDGKTLSLFTYAHLDLQNTQADRIPKSMLFVGYAVTRKDARQSGLARELYISALMRTVAEAQGKGRMLLFSMGECVDASERFWNDVGFDRIYVEAGMGGSTLPIYWELPYIQPVLDYDPATGKVAEGAGTAPEHLMVHGFTRETLTKKEIIGGVKSIYNYNNTWPREAFACERAYRVHLRHTASLAADLERFLMSNGEVAFLTRSLREYARSEGVTVLDHADPRSS